MPQWYFTKEELDKVIKSSPDPVEEVALRKRMCSFIQEAGIKLKLPQMTIATAIVYFQRFYATRSIYSHDRTITAIASLFLASKVDESPRKLQDVILHGFFLHTGGREMRHDGPEFYEARDKVLTCELQLLQHLSFDMSVELPYKSLNLFKKKLDRKLFSSLHALPHTHTHTHTTHTHTHTQRTHTRTHTTHALRSLTNKQTKMYDKKTRQAIEPQTEDQAVKQIAQYILNDSLVMNLFLRYRPQAIAAGALSMAAKTKHKELSVGGKKAWWEAFDVSSDDITQITAEIVQMYKHSSSAGPIASAAASNNNGGASSSPPTTSMIEIDSSSKLALYSPSTAHTSLIPTVPSPVTIPAVTPAPPPIATTPSPVTLELKRQLSSPKEEGECSDNEDVNCPPKQHAKLDN